MGCIVILNHVNLINQIYQTRSQKIRDHFFLMNDCLLSQPSVSFIHIPVICFVVSAGVYFAHQVPTLVREWLMAALWTTVPATVASLMFLCMNPDDV